MIDLSFSLNSFEPRSLLLSHAGAVYSCVTSPTTQLLATAGEDCELMRRPIIFIHVTFLLMYWLSLLSVVCYLM